MKYRVAMGWKLSAALWFYRTEAGTWRLLLASDEVSSKGPREAYTVVQRALADLGGMDHGVSLDEVGVIATDHPLIQPLRTFSGTVPGISPLRLSRSVVDGHYIDDALIYRII